VDNSRKDEDQSERRSQSAQKRQVVFVRRMKAPRIPPIISIKGTIKKRTLEQRIIDDMCESQ
jgi:hypothetical protein